MQDKSLFYKSHDIPDSRQCQVHKIKAPSVWCRRTFTDIFTDFTLSIVAEWKHVSAARFQNLVENPPRGAEATNGSSTITEVGRLGVHVLLLFVHQNKYRVVVLNVKLVCLFPSQEGFRK